MVFILLFIPAHRVAAVHAPRLTNPFHFDSVRSVCVCAVRLELIWPAEAEGDRHTSGSNGIRSDAQVLLRLCVARCVRFRRNYCRRLAQVESALIERKKPQYLCIASLPIRINDFYLLIGVTATKGNQSH